MSYANVQIAQIVAISNNRCIGKDNQLPWHLPADLQHFKRLTTHGKLTDDQQIHQNLAQNLAQGIVIMGRKTYESIGKPLPKRVNFIITTQLDYAENSNLVGRDDVHVVHNLDDALTQAASLAHGMGLDTIWVIGGEKIFAQAMMYTDRIEITEVDVSVVDGDAFYPKLPDEFKAVNKSQWKVENDLSYRFMCYQR